MDQIVAQALTEYGKIVGMKRKEATVKTESDGKVFVAVQTSNGASSPAAPIN
jgi:hypothetical protein